MKKSMLITLLLVLSAKLHAAEVRTASYWRDRLAKANQQNIEAMQQTSVNLKIVSAKKIQELTKQYIENNNPVLIVVKKEGLRTVWNSTQTSPELLPEVLQQTLYGTGYSLVTMTPAQGAVNYFIASDKESEIGEATFLSLSCTDLLESHLRMISARGQALRLQMQQSLGNSSFNFDGFMQDLNSEISNEGAKACF